MSDMAIKQCNNNNNNRQIEEMLNDSIWRKLRLEWAEGCKRSSKLHYWAGVCGDLVYKEWHAGRRNC